MTKKQRDNYFPVFASLGGSLALSDSTVWSIEPQDFQASIIISRFTELMKLWPVRNPNRRLAVFVEDGRMRIREKEFPGSWSTHSITGSGSSYPNSPFRSSPSKTTKSFTSEEQELICTFTRPVDSNTLAYQMYCIALFIAIETELAGGLLLHGALAKKNGRGVILAGPGGVGKTTASLRLRKPWHSLSDDVTLVVRDTKGKYWGHPWPTWSNLFFKCTGGSWNVQSSVPLVGVFFLTQAIEDNVVPLSVSQGICMLVKSSEQATTGMRSSGKKAFELRSHRVRRFASICEMAETVSCFDLRLSLTGAFWNKIEEVLDSCEGSLQS